MTEKTSCTAFFFATAPEARWLSHRLDLHSKIRLKPSLFLWGKVKAPKGDAPDSKSVLLVQTGIGPRAAEQAARYALSRFPITEAFLLGLAAGTDPSLKTGDAVLATEIRSTERSLEEGLKTDPVLRERVRRTLKGVQPSFVEGPILTVEKLIASPEEKLHLGAEWGCSCLEMEGAPIASEANRRKIPFAQIRWILDGAGDPLPDVGSWIDETGTSRAFRAFFSLVQKPRLFLEIPSFLWKVRKGLGSMNRFLRKWFEDEKMGPS